MAAIFNTRNLIILLLVICGACTRLIPHPFNFTAIGAIALFAGARLDNKYLAFLVPILAMVSTDLLLGFGGIDMVSVYFSLLLIVALGLLIKKKISFLSVGVGSIASSMLFYLITNFAVWPGNALYAQDLSGLLNSYIAGIPFFRNQVLGDLFYNALLFGSFYFAERNIPSFQSQKVKA